LAGACLAHMRRHCAPRGLGLRQWTLAHAAPLRVGFLKTDTRSDDLAEPLENEFDTYDTTITPHQFAIPLNTVLEQHQGECTG
jgi:hypothetical protein